MDEEEETEARAIEKAQFRPYLLIVFVDFHFSMGTTMTFTLETTLIISRDDTVQWVGCLLREILIY